MKNTVLVSCVVAALGLSGIVIATASSAPAPASTPSAAVVATVYVNTRTGDDSNDGQTAATAFKTVNWALEYMDNLGQPLTGEIIVRAPANYPVAPAGYGGSEQTGWQSPDPFPLVLVEGVTLKGITLSNNRPVITIDESSASFTAWNRSVVTLADRSAIVNFEIDGSRLTSSSTGANGNQVFVGVLVDRGEAEIRNCVITDWHTEVWVEPIVGLPVTLDIWRTTLSKAGPIGDPGEGHAALTFVGSGTATINLDESTIESSHDAFETYGNTGYFLNRATAPGTQLPNPGSVILNITDCVFDCNENGLEIGGINNVDIYVKDSSFLNHRPHTDAPIVVTNPPYSMPPLPGQNTAIGIRGYKGGTSVASVPINSEAFIHVRNCEFKDYSIAVACDAENASAKIDLGTAVPFSPGLNVFCQSFALTVDGCDPGNGLDPLESYRVAVWQASSTPMGAAPNVIEAAGNWWIPDNQDTPGAGNRIITGLKGTYTTGLHVVGIPHGMSDPRNYAIERPAIGENCGQINFGPVMSIGAPPVSCP